MRALRVLFIPAACLAAICQSKAADNRAGADIRADVSVRADADIRADAGGAPPGSNPAVHPRAEPLDIEMFYQYSATDDDAEVTIGIESPDNPIDSLVIVAPHGRAVATVRSRDRLGLAEVELESAEPSVDEVQGAYPEGTYRFSGRAVDGTRLTGSVHLSHEVVGAPDFFNFSPCDDEVDATGAVTIAWNSVAGAEGGYEIIIEQDETGANMRTTLTAERTSFVIPDGFLARGLEYEIEMKAVTGAGNKTSASCEFSTL